MRTSTTWLLLTAASFGAPCLAKDRALVVGISRYQAQGTPWVKYAKEDAENFARYLESPAGGGLKPILLTDQNATREAVLGALIRLGPRLSGTVYVFLSGRGWAPPEAGGTLLTYDAPVEKGDRPNESPAVTFEKIKNYLVQSGAQKIILYADLYREPAESGGDNRILNRLHELAAKVGPLEGIAATDKVRSKESDRLRGGVFTYYLLQAFKKFSPEKGAPAVLDSVSIDVGKETGGKQTPRLLEKSTRQITTLLWEPTRPEFPKWGLLAFLQSGLRALPGSLGFFQNALGDRVRLDSDFQQALQSDNLSGANGALGLLTKMEDLAGQTLPEERDQVAAAYAGRGQRVIAAYGTGDVFPSSSAWRDLQFRPSHFADAAQAFEEAHKLRPDDASLKARKYFCRGRAQLFDAKTADAARDDLMEALSLEPDFPEPHNALGIYHLEKAHYEDAIRSFREASTHSPRWAYPRHNLALALTEQGDYLGAEREYRRAIEATPYYPYLRHNLAVLLQRLGRTREAQREYNAAFKEFGVQEEEFRNRARAWCDDNRMAEAKAAQARADVLHENSAEPLNGLGTLQEARGHRKEALEAYDKALKINGKLIPARHNLANLLRPSDPAKAMNLWQQNLADDPKFQPSRIALDQMVEEQRGDQLLQQNNRPAACEAFGKAEALSRRIGSPSRALRGKHQRACRAK